MPQSKGLTCPRCGRGGFRKHSGLNQHLIRNAACRALLVISACNEPQNVVGTLSPVAAVTDPSVEAHSTINLAVDNNNATVPHNTMVLPSNLSDWDQDDALELDDDSDLVVAPVLPVGGNRKYFDDFQQYCGRAKHNFMAFSPDEAAAIQLARDLALKHASLDTYKCVMEWHLIQTEKHKKGVHQQKQTDGKASKSVQLQAKWGVQTI